AEAMGEDGLALDGPPELDYVRLRIDGLEGQIADRIGRLAESGPSTRPAVQADIDLRVVARSLLARGLENPQESALAVLYGHTLANHADAMEKLFWRLPSLDKELRGLPRAEAEKRRAALEQFSAELKRFHQASAQLADAIAGDDPAEVDRYMQKLLAPLAGIAQLFDQPPIRSTWLPARVEEGGPRGGPEAESDALGRMPQRIAGLRLPAATRTQLLRIVEALRQGLDEPGRRPDTMASYDLVRQVLDTAETFSRTEGLDETVMDDMRRQFHTAILLTRDPRTRSAAADRLRALDGDLVAIDRIGRLRKLAVPVGDLDAVRRLAYRMQQARQDMRTADRISRFLNEVLATMLAYRQQLGRDLPGDLNRVAAALRADYQRRELLLVGQLRTVLNRPGAIEDAQLLTAQEQMDGRLAQLRRLNLIPAWLKRMSRFRPRPAGGLYRQLRAMAMALTDRQRRAGEDVDWLGLLEEQMERFDPLPHERWLRQDSAAVQAVIGQTRYLLILGQLDALRQDWASAWASGRDPRPLAQRLGHLRRLVEALYLSSAAGNMEGAAQRLNRWAAWEVNPAAVRPLVSALPRRVALAAEFAATGDWRNLEAALDQIDEQSPIPLLMATLHQRLGKGLARLPDGVPGMLGQCLYAPRAGAFAAESRNELAQISLYLMEAAHARGAEGRDRIMSHAGQLARSLMDELAGSQAP
ncbi:MAG: hypothetical protein OER86_08345, partial [Phycisphaerae bacterium]|nr:hypothetical protein [Phycisphaerae bacterium]